MQWFSPPNLWLDVELFVVMMLFLWILHFDHHQYRHWYRSRTQILDVLSQLKHPLTSQPIMQTSSFWMGYFTSVSLSLIENWRVLLRVFFSPTNSLDALNYTITKWMYYNLISIKLDRNFLWELISSWYFHRDYTFTIRSLLDYWFFVQNDFQLFSKIITKSYRSLMKRNWNWKWCWVCAGLYIWMSTPFPCVCAYFIYLLFNYDDRMIPFKRKGRDIIFFHPDSHSFNW